MSDPTHQPISKPIYADRLSGENFADATGMVNAYLARYAAQLPEKGAAPGGAGEPPRLDDSGYAQLHQGSATIGINVLEDRGVLMIFAPIMPVPITGLQAFYRKLLELSFIATADAAFAIDAARDEVVVRCLRRLSALDYEEFEDLVATCSQVADAWDDVLRAEFGT